MALKRATYEQSPVALFLDFQLPQMIAANQARERAMQHEMAMEDKRAERQMNLEAYRANEERLTNLQDQFIDKGLKVGSEFQTSGYADLSQQILDDTKNKSQALLDTIQQGDRQISWMENELADLKAGSLFAERMEDKYGSSIAATENEAVKNYMLEGQLLQDDEGKWKGTKELDNMFAGLTADEKANFTSNTFRQGFMQGRRTESVAKEMHQIDQTLALTDIEIANAQYTKDTTRLDDASTALQLSMKNYGNTYAGRLMLGDTSYGMIELLDTDAQVDIFKNFKSMLDNGEITESVYDDVYSSISALRTAAKSGDPYPEKYFVQMAAQAHDDILAYTMKNAQAKANPSLKDDPVFYAEWQALTRKWDSWNKVGLGDMVSLSKAKQLNQAFSKVQDANLNLILDRAPMPEDQPSGMDPALEKEILDAINKQTETTQIEMQQDKTLGDYASVIGATPSSFVQGTQDILTNILAMDAGQETYENLDYLFNTPLSQFKIEDIKRRYKETMHALPGAGLIYKPLDELIQSLIR